MYSNDGMWGQANISELTSVSLKGWSRLCPYKAEVWKTTLAILSSEELLQSVLFIRCCRHIRPQGTEVTMLFPPVACPDLPSLLP